MSGTRVVIWFSCGATSAVAAKLALGMAPDVETHVVYIDTGSEHPDNVRFLADVSRWLDHPIETVRSEKYADIWDVFTSRRYIAGIAGAPCTLELKKAVREKWEKEHEWTVWERQVFADAAMAATGGKGVEEYPHGVSAGNSSEAVAYSAKHNCPACGAPVKRTNTNRLGGGEDREENWKYTYLPAKPAQDGAGYRVPTVEDARKLLRFGGVTIGAQEYAPCMLEALKQIGAVIPLAAGRAEVGGE